MRYLLLFLWSFSLHAGTFHAVLVADTKAKKIGKSSEYSLHHMQNFLTSIAGSCEMALELNVLSGEELSLDSLIMLLASLDVGEEDTLFFGFWGHGESFSKPWPSLYITKEERTVSFQAVIEYLRSYSPKLLIALADCCNATLAPRYEANREADYLKNQSDKIKALFKDPTGEVLISSAATGETAYARGKEGHLFTNGLLRTIRYQTKRKDPVSWESILKMAEGQAILYQRPYSEIAIN